jgi:hypothetical protein
LAFRGYCLPLIPCLVQLRSRRGYRRIAAAKSSGAMAAQAASAVIFRLVSMYPPPPGAETHADAKIISAE